MAETDYPDYFNDSLDLVSDADLELILKELIDEAMILHGVYHDNDHRAAAVASIYPVISNIVHNADFRWLRRRKALLEDLIACLVTRLV